MALDPRAIEAMKAKVDAAPSIIEKDRLVNSLLQVAECEADVQAIMAAVSTVDV